ncbi:MAG: GNAT family N-acetyltransferase [Anaerolineales bacterium]|jgi:ribosomal protein S18 acetylase RimI-like enzyme
MNHFSIREYHFPEDYDAARQLWEGAGPGIHVRRSDEPGEIQKKLQRDPDLFLVAEADGRLIGTVCGGFDGRRGMVYHLAVEESYRRSGIGEKLMGELENRLRLKGCLRCYLLVTIDNENAITFYKRRGWERMDTVFIY